MFVLHDITIYKKDFSRVFYLYKRVVVNIYKEKEKKRMLRKRRRKKKKKKRHQAYDIPSNLKKVTLLFKVARRVSPDLNFPLFVLHIKCVHDSIVK